MEEYYSAEKDVLKAIKKVVNSQIRDSLYSFLKKSFATITPNVDFNENWHLRMICDALQMCADGKIKRLIINLPPRYLKSFCVSVSFPAWLLGTQPHKRIIMSSYSQVLSVKHATDCRTILKSEWYKEAFDDTYIIDGQDTKTKFVTEQKGYYFATSIGGTLIGEGGNILIVDDPQTPLNVTSKKQREQVINWFKTSLMSRLNDKNKDVIIIVMQRLHQFDLSGYLIENEKEDWTHISFPAIAKENQDVIFNDKLYHHRESGEALHPSREDKSVLNSIAKAIGTYSFCSQYQQDPILSEGGLVKQEWIIYYDQEEDKYKSLGHYLDIYITIDCAKSAMNSADYTAIIVIGVDIEKNSFVINVTRGRYIYPELKKIVQELIKKYNPSAVLIEDTSNGSSLLQELKFEGYNFIIPIRPKQDKISRFNHALISIESGKFFVPKKANFLSDLIEELLSFPFGKNDDQVDAISQYFGWIYKNTKYSQFSPKIRQI